MVDLSLLLASGNPLASLRALAYSKRQRLKYIETYEFPSGLKRRFARSKNFLDATQQELVFSALRDYFYVCHQSGKFMASMPSQIVDDAWHEFILFTKDYNDFCLKAFGRYLHHTPAEAMKSQTIAQKGIRRTWRIACRKEGINPVQPHKLPLIFAIDGLLNIPNGFVYDLNCLASNRSNYCATHIGCGGSDSHSSGCDGDGSASNGGCDSSCGSSCGGGCGGGCGGS